MVSEDNVSAIVELQDDVIGGVVATELHVQDTIDSNLERNEEQSMIIFSKNQVTTHLTDLLTLLKPQDQLISECYLVQKRRATDFEVL